MSATFSVARDFSRTPGPRYINEGDFSGQLFREQFLLPIVREAISSKSMLRVDLDGTAGYGTSFLEEAFGGLVRENHIPLNDLLPILDIKSDEEDYLVEDITGYLKDASEKRNEGK